MRTVSAQALVLAQSVDGVESSVKIEIDIDGTLTFDDDDRIVSLGNVSITVNDKGATAGSVSVELDDSDEYFLDLLCTTRFEGRTARIYQVFDGTETVELMVGRIGSPVVWEEQTRTFKFDIVAFYRAADNEIPYAPEEDSDLAEAAWNQVWPRIYGTPIDVPAQQVTFAPTGTLIRELRPENESFEIEVADDVEFELGVEVTVQVGNEYITGTFSSVSTDPTTILRFDINSRNVSKGIIYSKSRLTLTEIEEHPAGWTDTWEIDPRYAAWDTEGRVLAGNWLILLDSETLIDSGSVNLVGYTATHLYGQFQLPSFAANKGYILYQKGDATRAQLPWIGPGGIQWIGLGVRADIRGVLDVNETLWPAGTTVELVTSVKYVVSDLPVDSVLRVRAWREVRLDERGGRRRELVTLPTDFYTTRLNDTVDGRTCSTIEFERTLSSRNSGWDNEVLVTARRGDGNVATIITEILEDAGLTVDTGTVEDECAAYPMDFALLDRRDSLELAYDIAWQGRCGLSVLGSTATLKYLSAEPTSYVFAHTEDTVLEATLQLTTSEMSNIVNDWWVLWRKRYSQRDKRLHYKNAESIAAYGRNKSEVTIYVYRHKSLVQKTAQFWFNRMSRVWRKLRIVGDLDAIAVTAYDDVRIVLPELTTYSMAESVEHDTETDTIAMMVWTPVEVGSCSASEYAYLDDSEDSAPSSLSFADPGDVAEVIEVGPLDLGLTEAETHVAEATSDQVDAGPIYGEFNAKLYKGSTPDGEVVEEEVTVVNLTPDQQVVTGDIVAVHKAKDGGYYATPGGGGTSAYWANVSSAGETSLEADIFEVVEDASNLIESGATVKLVAGSAAEGDTVVVYKGADGTYWTLGQTLGSMGIAKTLASTSDKNSISLGIYLVSPISGSPDIVATGKCPTLSGSIPAGYWAPAVKVGETWIFLPPVYA